MRMIRTTGLIGGTIALAFIVCALMQPVACGQQKADKAVAVAEKDVPQYLQDISITIRAQGAGGGAEGSGVFKVTKDGQVWIWTCGHLVQKVREIRTDDAGKKFVEFTDCKVISVITEDGRKTGELTFDAEVIRYSDAVHGDDLALLRLRTKKYQPRASAQFYLEKDIPAIGTKLLHCGSLLGQLGSNSVTNGIVSQHGRVLFNNTVFDQTNCACFPGSSGGIICLEKDGRYVGMLVRGAGETFGLYVPIRRMRDWAKRVGVEFTLDDALPIPSDAELRKLPADDASCTNGKCDVNSGKAFRTRERLLESLEPSHKTALDAFLPRR